MLKFIFGLPRSGKTTKILSLVKELNYLKKQSVIIVPEQATFETEKAVLKALGDSAALNCQVLSFSRLYDDISRNVGGISAKVLGDCDKILFMSKALRTVADDLKVWGRYANSLNFAQKMLDTIGEFKICAISSNQIKNAQHLADTQALTDKLYDIGLIYDTYEALLAERFLDPIDKLTKLYSSLEGNKFFAQKTVFIDGFKGFSGQQFKILSRILSQADDVYISLTNKTGDIREYDVFSNIRSCVSKIESIAKTHNVKIEEPIILCETFYNSQELKKVERLLSSNCNDSINDDSVTIYGGGTVFEEAEFAARTIRKLVRTQNYRYRDFAIIVRDTESYSTAVDYACRKNNVACFSDKRLSLSNFPLSVTVLSAIKALNFSTENILKFYKSGIDVLSVDEISILENYTYLWNINGKTWLENWEMDVRGFVTEEFDQNAEAELLNINLLRQKAVSPLLTFKESFFGNARKRAAAVMQLLENCGATNSLKNICNNISSFDSFSGDALKQGYDLFIDILDSLVICFGEKDISSTEFYEALNLAVSLEEAGVIPQTVDQVVFGQADRIRTENTKVAFILGANQGVFPKFSESGGVFSNKERKKLICLDLELNDNQLYVAIDENFLVYCNLCCPSDKLFITYSTHTLKGEALTKSSFVQNICEGLKLEALENPLKLNKAVLPETVNSAFSELCRTANAPSQFFTLKEALDKVSPDKTNDLILSLEKVPNNIKNENAQNLYGKNIYMSATKFDTFNRCKFSYFCKYGLRLKRLQPADFDVLQRGTIVHYVLEKIVSEYKEGIKDFTREQLDRLCDFYIEEYLNSVVGYNNVKTARHEFLISKISRSLKEVVFHLSNEFAQSDFKPIHCELKIGGKEGIPLDFDYSKGKIIVNGSIDRVDQFGAFIRIVDYKTGSKSFKLPDILFGLNLQMLLYLYAIIRGQSLEDTTAAGIFYMPSKRDLNNEGMAMNGLMPADIDLVRAMDKENKGEYVPALSLNKDGSVSKSASSFITAEDFSKIFDYIEKLMKKTGDSISNGEITINPTDGRESSACDYCDFRSICCVEEDISTKVPSLKNDQVLERLEMGDSDGI